jgi:phage repressor protein C with HTH and peptisase S24 domain
MLQFFKISGNSLYPFYKNGERVICRKIFSKTTIYVDDTVIFEKENYGLMIKKVKYVKDNRYFVEGTTPYSIDSRNFGELSKEELKYKVWFTI